MRAVPRERHQKLARRVTAREEFRAARSLVAKNAGPVPRSPGRLSETGHLSQTAPGEARGPTARLAGCWALEMAAEQKCRRTHSPSARPRLREESHVTCVEKENGGL